MSNPDNSNILTEQNDAIAQVDCKIYTKCCDSPKFINQFGSRECVCVSCKRRCRNCEGDYLGKFPRGSL
jgi:hypothetical protein